jgi:hypothetical protein
LEVCRFGARDEVYEKSLCTSLMFGCGGRGSSALSVRAERSRCGLDVDAQAYFEGNRFRHWLSGDGRGIRSSVCSSASGIVARCEGLALEQSGGVFLAWY